MKCHGCNSLMVLQKQETGSGSTSQWHGCPLCGKVRLTSQPADPVDQHASLNGAASVSYTIGRSVETKKENRKAPAHSPQAQRKRTPDFA